MRFDFFCSSLNLRLFNLKKIVHLLFLLLCYFFLTIWLLFFLLQMTKDCICCVWMHLEFCFFLLVSLCLSSLIYISLYDSVAHGKKNSSHRGWAAIFVTWHCFKTEDKLDISPELECPVRGFSWLNHSGDKKTNKQKKNLSLSKFFAVFSFYFHSSNE